MGAGECKCWNEKKKDRYPAAGVERRNRASQPAGQRELQVSLRTSERKRTAHIPGCWLEHQTRNRHEALPLRRKARQGRSRQELPRTANEICRSHPCAKNGKP